MRITVRLKLSLALAVVIAFLVMMAWLGISNLASLNANIDSKAQGPAQRVERM